MIGLIEIKKMLSEVEVSYVEEINESTKVFQELSVNSLSIMQLICCFEEKYNVSFNEEQLEFEESLTIGELLNLFNLSFID
ncbi:MAG: hypothetical protein HFI77_12705 [Lachnospiraceae bacterium]|nr:hypothetical protein [Lachnospiraceae bacterium]